jgi:hypothetical protein
LLSSSLVFSSLASLRELDDFIEILILTSMYNLR